MAIQSSFYNTDGTTRTFPSTKHIATKQHCAVYLKLVSDSSWEVVSISDYELVNNSVVFITAPSTIVYSMVEVRVADEQDELSSSPSDVALVASSIANVNILANSIDSVDSVAASIANVNAVGLDLLEPISEINTVAADIANVNIVAANILDVNTVATNISDIDSIASTIVPNIAEILLADTNAATATTQAGIATTQAGIATTKASEASASATLAEGYANSINPSSLVSSSTYESHVALSGITSYHLLSGNLALSNSVTDTGFGTTLYTGNGSTQSVVTGIDMSTQWGNSADETFGGLVWGKSRSNALDNFLVDTVRGTTKGVITNSTSVETTNSTVLTAFNSNGFSLGNHAALNTNLATYASWNFQTTHRTSGTTNHGKAYTCHYNPFTGFTIIKYEGSGIAGHEIPHHLGRKLGFFTLKDLSIINNWSSQYYGQTTGQTLVLNATTASTADASYSTINDDSVAVSADPRVNTSTNQYIMYGWANSYFDESNTLIGNYEVGVYQGTGASGNKVTTKGKPAWVMTKRLDGVSDWLIYDVLRNAFDNNVYANSSVAEATNSFMDVSADGFTLTNSTGQNISGGQYLYMVVYDNDSGSGKSKYPRATDTSTLNLNATVPFANGVDANGTKNTILTKNETVSGLTLTQGKNYVYAKNGGTYGVTPHAPQYGSYNGFGDYFDTNKNQWYSGVNKITNGSFTTDVSGWSLSAGGDTATFVWSNGSVLVDRNGGSAVGHGQDFNTEVGQLYRVKFDIPYWNASTNLSSVVIWDSVGAEITRLQFNAMGFYAFNFIATSTTSRVLLAISGGGAQEFSIDNIAIYPINNDGSVDTSSATPITESRNYLDAIVYADAGGQPVYVEQLPKTEYKDVIKANEYQGKNACTAWVNFDGTTTPPTIRDSYNVSAVIRTATGAYDIYFKTPMDNNNYVISGSHEPISGYASELSRSYGSKYVSKFSVGTYSETAAGAITASNSADVGVQIKGGKN